MSSAPELRAADREGPGSASPRSRALAAPLGGAAVAGAALGVLHRTGGWHLGPFATCWFHAGTGLWCPFCGGLRAVAALTHGQVVAALALNLPVVLLLPLAVAIWVHRLRWALRGRVVDQPRLGNRGLVVVGAVLLAYTLLRNTSYGAWLAP